MDETLTDPNLLNKLQTDYLSAEKTNSHVDQVSYVRGSALVQELKGQDPNVMNQGSSKDQKDTLPFALK